MDAQTELKKLKELYAKGLLSAELAGEKLTFASGKELRLRIRDLESQISGGAGGGMTVSYATTGRGL